MPGEMTSDIELYDHDIQAIGEVLGQLKLRQETVVPLESYRKEMIGRFADIGLVANVQVWSTDAEGVYWFDITIAGRLEPTVFDHDRQVAEVTRDLLGLGEGGVISTRHLRPIEGGQGRNCAR